MASDEDEVLLALALGQRVDLVGMVEHDRISAMASSSSMIVRISSPNFMPRTRAR